MTSQNEKFLQGEGDNWFQRNKMALKSQDGGSPEVGWLCDQLMPFKDQINAVLEIGSSNGDKLRQICRTLDCRGEGIDPSRYAVNEGNAAGGVQLHVGTASALPCATGSLDFVYFGFCLYLLDRSELLVAVAEANRVLIPGGFLAITDFDPVRRHKRPYHHKDGVFSYKQDYSQCFTNTGLYSLIAKHSFSHRQFHFDTDGNERVSTTIMFKEIDPY